MTGQGAKMPDTGADAGGAAAVDGLSLLAPLLRVRPELESLCRFGAQWWRPHDAVGGGWAPFHMVAAGVCYLDLPGHAPVTLNAGDIALLPHGGAHTVRGAATPANHVSALATASPLSEHNGVIDIKRAADGGTGTELICGQLRFDQAPDALVLSTLPSLIVVRGGCARTQRVGTLLMALHEELSQVLPGAVAVAGDLASAALVMVLREHFAANPADSALLRLLAHRQTARLVAALLADPARPWTLDEMADAAHTSRATLVRLFQREAGMAPLALLAELRLTLARQRLATTNDALIDVALDAGYQSESAFSRAFRRRFDMPPGEARRVGQAQT